MKNQQTQTMTLHEPDNHAPQPYVPIEGEQWRNVPGYPSLQASNLGRVRLKESQHVLAITTGEYPRVSFTHAGKTRTVETHRLCALAFFGPIGPGLVVNHKDGDKMNCCIENLEIITHAQNIQEAQRAGLMKSKLQPRDVVAVRKLLAEAVPVATVASAFNVKPQAIQNISAGRSWRAIPNESGRSESKNLSLDFMETIS